MSRREWALLAAYCLVLGDSVVGGLNVIGQAIPLAVLAAGLAVVAWCIMGRAHIDKTTRRSHLYTAPAGTSADEPGWTYIGATDGGVTLETPASGPGMLIGDGQAAWSRPDADVAGELRTAMRNIWNDSWLTPSQPPVPLQPSGYYHDEAARRHWYRSPGGALYSWTDEQLRAVPAEQYPGHIPRWEVVATHPYLPEGQAVAYQPDAEFRQTMDRLEGQMRASIEAGHLTDYGQHDPGYAAREALIEEFRTLATTDATTEPEPYETDPRHWVNREHP